MFYQLGNKHLWISIHAPREGGDGSYMHTCDFWDEFQSTPPARGATVPPVIMVMTPEFQSTPPARGATPAHD